MRRFSLLSFALFGFRVVFKRNSGWCSCKFFFRARTFLPPPLLCNAYLNSFRFLGFSFRFVLCPGGLREDPGGPGKSHGGLCGASGPPGAPGTRARTPKLFFLWQGPNKPHLLLWSSPGHETFLCTSLAHRHGRRRPTLRFHMNFEQSRNALRFRVPSIGPSRFRLD